MLAFFCTGGGALCAGFASHLSRVSERVGVGDLASLLCSPYLGIAFATAGNGNHWEGPLWRPPDSTAFLDLVFGAAGGACFGQRCDPAVLAWCNDGRFACLVLFCWSAVCCSSVWVGGRGGIAWSVACLVGCVRRCAMGLVTWNFQNHLLRSCLFGPFFRGHLLGCEVGWAGFFGRVFAAYWRRLATEAFGFRYFRFRSIFVSGFGFQLRHAWRLAAEVACSWRLNV